MNIRFKRYRFQNEAGGAGDGGGSGGGAAPGGAAQPPAFAWLGENPDAELVGHVQNKAWQSPADAVKSHRELEKLFGADRAGRTLTLPSDDTPEAWAPVWDKLGRPATPDGYKLPVPEGADAAYATAMAEVMHKHGISATAAKALAEANNQFLANALADQDAQAQATFEAEQAQLKKDWGGEYDARREVARRAAVHLGLDEGAIDALEKASGYSKTLKALAKVGDLLGEHGIEGVGTPGSFGMTPEGAAAQKSQLMADADWRAKAMVKGSKEWAELTRLDGIIAAAMQ